MSTCRHVVVWASSSAYMMTIYSTEVEGGSQREVSIEHWQYHSCRTKTHPISVQLAQPRQCIDDSQYKAFNPYACRAHPYPTTDASQDPSQICEWSEHLCHKMCGMFGESALREASCYMSSSFLRQRLFGDVDSVYLVSGNVDSVAVDVWELQHRNHASRQMDSFSCGIHALNGQDVTFTDTMIVFSTVGATILAGMMTTDTSNKSGLQDSPL